VSKRKILSIAQISALENRGNVKCRFVVILEMLSVKNVKRQIVEMLNVKNVKHQIVEMLSIKS